MKQIKTVWVKPEIRQAFEAKVVETIEKAKAFCDEILHIPTVEFAHLGGPAGKCRQTGDRAIVFINVDYFEQDYEYVLNQTCPHEVAHYVTVRKYGDKVQAHGVEWKHVMRRLGLKADRCHKMDSSKTKLRKVARPYKYTCGCKGKEFLLTFRKHNQHQTRKYFCRQCKNTLVYEGMMKGNVFIPKVQRTTKPIVTQEVEILPVTVPAPKPPEPKPTHRVVTRFVGGVLTNVRVPIEQAA